MSADQPGPPQSLDDRDGLRGAPRREPAPGRRAARPYHSAQGGTAASVPDRTAEPRGPGPDEWAQGSMPGRSAGEEGSTQILRAGDESWIVAAVAADPATSGEISPTRTDGPAAWADSTDDRGDSVLGRLGQMSDRPQAPPLSLAPEEWIPVDLPEQFGRYRIIERLAKGAMGSIYLAQDTELGRRVALKVPHLRRAEEGAADSRLLERFYHEARAAATLDHPNLCPVYDVGECQGIPYLTMAYVKGRPLSEYIRRERPMPQRRAVVMVRKLAQALEEAHYNGVVHRDLKPSNIMVTERGDLVIVDFGLVWRIGATGERLTRVGLVVGTPMYMSPEQASGRVEDIGPGCDIYSLGVIMYELLTGRPPFEGPEAVVLGQILFVEPPPPSRYRPELDPWLEAICLKAIAKGLDRRFPTMGELAMALGDYLRSADDVPRLIDTPAPAAPTGAVPAAAREIIEGRVDVPSAPPAMPPEAGDEVPELPIDVPESGVLWKAWRQWTAIVEHFALRRSAARVNLQHYDQLYRTLLLGIRARAAKAHGVRQEFYLRLADLVVPWMKPATLRATDQEILSSLLCYCRQLERELLDPTELPLERGDSRSARFGWRLALTVLVASFLLALLAIYLGS